MEEIKRIKFLLNELCTDLTVYTQIYGDEQSVSVLNEFNPLVFGRIQKACINNLFMGFSRLLDPAFSGRERNRNLTLNYIVEAYDLGSDEDVSEAMSLVKKLHDETNIRVFRNKLLGHSDLAAQLGNISVSTNVTPEKARELLAAMYNVINKIEFKLGHVEFCVHSTADMVLPREFDGYSFIDKLGKNV
ncbi:AbiU2 domain-containing protein [Vibrio parahaemolyticus]|uniref:AbiU2 domain-containing protein n=1 Tax=Vibrio parahaemolyticus TaxID=670 RepID=UPI00215CBF18|nr:hypothetical protein [Vibrio parahaemolyticus]MCR9818739.1 hypothetical protein [Vibrio parahaemolyticus]